MNKKKASKNKYQLDLLHSISILSLEEMRNRILSLEQINRAISIKQISPDAFRFLIKNLENGVEILGLTQRWNGTFTRLDVQEILETRSQRTMLYWIGLHVCLSLLAVYINFLQQPYTYHHPGDFIMKFLGFAMLIFVLLGMLWGMITTFRVKFFSYNPEQIRYEIEDSLQALADKITENLNDANLNFDGTEDSLERLLTEEKYKHFRLEADGELYTP